MGRWEPDARSRLERAALELFLAHGFDDVTVPQITARAGLTTRTFHRHFIDKREVLFSDADQMPALAARLVLDAPPELAPLDVVAQGLSTLASAAFEGRLQQLKQRTTVIDGHDGLRERELRKMERLTRAIADAFEQRGVDDLTAAVMAETTVGVVKVALRRWLRSDGEQPLQTIMTDSLTRLRDAFSGIGSPSTSASQPAGQTVDKRPAPRVDRS
jgi:AcrR family transcriptional regulator